jgi:hypothetical protein
MSDYGAERALMALPADGRLHVQLSRYFYALTLKRVRSDLEGNRSGLALVEVATPLDAPVVEIALDRRSLSLFALRRRGAREWWGFVRDGCPPACRALPCGRSTPATHTPSSACRRAST